MKFIFILFLSLNAFSQTGYPLQGVSILFEKEGIIKNEFCFPVMVRVNNLTFAVAAKSSQTIGANSWGSWNWIPGRETTITEKVMKSPLKTRHLVDFGPGLGAHEGVDQFGYDFSVPEGTPVYASEGGVVVRRLNEHATAHQNKLMKDNANLLEILHEDGTIARYVHLKRASVWPNHCDRVQAGQEIGLSGNTGYSKGPHLHLDVFMATADGKYKTIPLTIVPAN